MMERQVVLYMVAGLLQPSVGYNLAVGGGQSVVLQPPDSRGEEPLFGWSVENFKGDTFVGAPQAGNKVGGGAVYKCPNDRNRNNICLNIKSTKDLRDVQYGWYGASFAAGVNEIYTCAPFRGTAKWWTPSWGTGLQLSKSRVLGECFKYDKNSRKFSRSTEFRHSYPFNGNNFNQHWAQRGSMGLATITADDDNIVVGAPLATAFQDWTGTSPKLKNPRYVHGQDYHSGAIVKYAKISDQNRQIWPKVDESQFVILDIEAHGKWAEMRNHYKMAGIAIDKGKLYETSSSSYLIGAPKADNNLGKVYVCSNCFKDNPVGRFGVVFPEGNFEVKPSADNRQIGEKFGASVAACDVNGDGYDDVIVGAPFYSDNTHDTFNTGRVHVFVKAAKGVKKGLPETLAPHLPRGSRFGTALACMGDTNGDMYQEVVVGAPYYDYYSTGSTSGVIFIYQGYHLGLQKDYSQKIVASDVNSRLKGFGISFSRRGSVSCGNGRAPDCSQCNTCAGDCEKKCIGGSCFNAELCKPKHDKFDSITGLSVGAHLSNNALYMQFRKVPRFLDVSTIEKPDNIDPEKPGENSIMVIFTPKISKTFKDQKASLDVDLEVTITVQMDIGRGRIADNIKTAESVIRKGKSFGQPEAFRFVIDQSKIGKKDGKRVKPAPISVDVTAKWTLKPCTDSSTSICPILDPEDTKDNAGKFIEMRHKRRNIIVKSGCVDSDKCKCDIKTKVDHLTRSVTVGENREENLIQITLENVDREPAFGTNITVFSPIQVVRASDYDVRKVEDKQNFVVPFIAGSSTTTITLTMRTVDISSDKSELTIYVTVVPDCPKKQQQKKSVTIGVEHKWNVVTSPQYPNQEGVDIFNWDWRNEDTNTKIITQTFKIINQGPSPSGKSEVYVFIPKSHKLLSGHQVKLEGHPTSNCIDQNIQVPSDIQARSCSFSGACVVKKCSVSSIDKQKYVNLVVTVIFNLETAKTTEKPSFDVVTSVQSNDIQNAKTTSFWKTTLAYRSQSVLQQIFNNWYVIAGVIVGLIVLIIISIILYQCNVFSGVRIYKDKVDEAQGTSMDMDKTGDPK